MQLHARIGITLLALAVAGGLAYGFLPRPAQVDVVTAGKGPLVVTVEEEGKTRVRDRYVISAPMTGFARRIDLEPGDAVKAGQVLAVIEPVRSDALDPRTRAQAAAQVKAAAAAVSAASENARAATAQAELARQEQERLSRLRQSNFISEQALDRARAEFRRALAVQQAMNHNVSVARFELDMARSVLAKSDKLLAGGPAETLAIKSPVDARVLRVAHESEGTVQAGVPLLEIGNPEALEVEVEVLSTQAVKIAPGSRVLFDRWGGDTVLQGSVRVVEPTGFTKVSALGVEEQRVKVIVDFTSPRAEWQRLGDGYRIEARFVVWEGEDVLQVPASALFRHNNGWAVFVVEGRHAKLKPVEIGQRAGLVAQIVAGLKVGDRIINHPDDKIRDGVRIKPRKV